MEAIIPEAIENYARSHSSAPSALLTELETYTRAHRSDAEMLIGALEAALLQMLIRLGHVRRVLEIGLFTGYSALAMAEVLPDDGEVISCDINPETTAIAQRFFERSPHGRKITVRLAPALETLATLHGESFDLVFLDADKENYPAYYTQVLPLVRPGGLIVADNVLWSGRVLAPEKASDHALARFNAEVARDPSVSQVLLTMRDGVMVIRKNGGETSAPPTSAPNRGR
jgi:caffeoyl-CoA O-methyltransferase